MSSPPPESLVYGGDAAARYRIAFVDIVDQDPVYELAEGYA